MSTPDAAGFLFLTRSGIWTWITLLPAVGAIMDRCTRSVRQVLVPATLGFLIWPEVGAAYIGTGLGTGLTEELRPVEEII